MNPVFIEAKSGNLINLTQVQYFGITTVYSTSHQTYFYVYAAFYEDFQNIICFNTKEEAEEYLSKLKNTLILLGTVIIPIGVEQKEKENEK